jgi:hypothetical protein
MGAVNDYLMESRYLIWLGDLSVFLTSQTSPEIPIWFLKWDCTHDIQAS